MRLSSLRMLLSQLSKAMQAERTWYWTVFTLAVKFSAELHA